MKVYIWGTGKMAEQCFKDILSDIEVCGFVESRPSKIKFLEKPVISGQELENKQYDYIILANIHEKEIMEEFKLRETKVIYYRMFLNVDSEGTVTYERKKMPVEEKLFHSQETLQILELARGVMPCVSTKIDGLKFVFDHRERLILNDMIAYGETFAKQEIEFFYEIAPKRKEGYFIEIGANVGTTSIYFKKNIVNSLKHICFEPLEINYKYLKMNCILNDCEDIQVEKMGISDKNEQRKMFVFDGAFGSSMVSEQKTATTVCNFMTLDKYVIENAIELEQIGYLWVDVQGHELEVIEGAKKTLSKSPASLYIEFNIAMLKNVEKKAERFLNTLAEIYTSFIVYEQYMFTGKKDLRSTKELINLLYEIDIDFCNILLIK